MKVSVLLLSFLISSVAFANKPTVDLKNSKVNWFAKKVIGNDSHKGFIPLASAEVTAGPKGEVTGGTFVFNMKGFESTDLTGNMKAKFEGHLKSADFFDVEKAGNDKATLKITKIEGTKATGELTIMGTTKPIELAFTQTGKTYTGKYTLDRTQFGIKYGSNSFFKGLGDKAIDDKVEIDFNIAMN